MAHDIELSISCSDCVRRTTPDCADCLVSFVLGGEPEHLEMTTHDVDVVELFTSHGMMPHLRYERNRAGTTTPD